MDQAAVRQHAQAHGQAVVDNDLNKAGGDLTGDVLTYVADIMKQLPRPVTAAEVVDVAEDGDAYTAQIRYSGDDKTVNVRSRWQDVEGRPRIVELKVMSD
ncbi:MAG: hypothetical protein ACR2LG_07710 [Actinomycetota bacterium]